MSAPIELPLSKITPDKSVWPRLDLDNERVALFMEMYQDDGPSALPPIDVIPLGDGRYYIGDGWTRCVAAARLRWKTIPAIVVAPEGDPLQYAYEHALRTAARAARPLTRVERRRAVARLLEFDPSRSDRDIASLVGVAHTTVGRLRKTLVAGAPDVSRGEIGETYLRQLSAEDVARRLFSALSKLEDARGIGDLIRGDQTSVRLARIFSDQFGDDAIERAQHYRSWIDGAIASLQKGART